MAFKTMDIDKVGQINNNLNNMIQQHFASNNTVRGEGDERIIFETMNKQKTGTLAAGR
jgi:hypothetical protein